MNNEDRISSTENMSSSRIPPTFSAPPSAPSPTPQKQKSFFGEILKFVLIAVVIVVPFRVYVAQPFIVSGASMDPTFDNGEYLVVDQLSYQFESPARGDVIIFRYPKDPSKFFIKRVIGLPNETVEIHSGVVVIKNNNFPEGFTLTEDYVTVKNAKTDSTTTTLGDGEYFVLGDNRIASLDSRVWGPVPENLVTGRPILRVLPFEKLGLFPGKETFDR